ncbi:putative peptidase M16 domain-containing protein [Rosa chinensis]|uniref:Putative peptidase M16 domain-containing protein n=1 Tax=Rosa chinensis TaxID=74649 RepID=A0A2P6SBZ3_ROSCH|nr:putative peptidase M16 domain-containing protein [Rosa chinensis]
MRLPIRLLPHLILTSGFCGLAGVAKLETLVSVSTDKLELKVYGFNDKLPALLSKILKTTKSFMPISDCFMICLVIHPLLSTLCLVFKFHIDKNTLLVSGLFMTVTLNRLLNVDMQVYVWLYKTGSRTIQKHSEGGCHEPVQNKFATVISQVSETDLQFVFGDAKQT